MVLKSSLVRSLMNFSFRAHSSLPNLDGKYATVMLLLRSNLSPLPRILLSGSGIPIITLLKLLLISKREHEATDGDLPCKVQGSKVVIIMAPRNCSRLYRKSV